MSIVATPRRGVLDYIGPQTVPDSIRNLRQSSIDYHKTLGQLVIHKHRWNERDVQEGRAERCPFHDEAYGHMSAYDPYCFGTGYLGGYDDGVAVPVTIGDTQEDVFRPNPQGVLIHERHPGLTAPWYPEMGDLDLIIVAEFIPGTYEITELGDRYVLREITPVTIRGMGFDNTLHTKPFKVSQAATIDLLPYGHDLQNVPINFDYAQVPIPLPPDYPPLPEGYRFSTFEHSVRLVGREVLIGRYFSSIDRDVRLAVNPEISRTQNIRLHGAPGGTHFNWENE